MKDPWLAFQKLVSSLNWPHASVDVARVSDNELFGNFSDLKCSYSRKNDVSEEFFFFDILKKVIFPVFVFKNVFLCGRRRSLFVDVVGSILVRMATHSQVDGGFIERFICHFVENVVARRSQRSRDVKITGHLSSSIVFFSQSHHPTEQCHATSNLTTRPSCITDVSLVRHWCWIVNRAVVASGCSHSPSW